MLLLYGVTGQVALALIEWDHVGPDLGVTVLTWCYRLGGVGCDGAGPCVT